MSTSEPKDPGNGGAAPVGELGEEPMDGEARAEAEWLLARETSPEAAAPSAELAEQHEELSHLLATLPAGKSEERRHAAVLERVAAARAAKSAERAAKRASSPSPGPSSGRPVSPSPGPSSTPAVPAPRAWWRRPAVQGAAGALAIAAAVALWLNLRPNRPPAPSEIHLAVYHQEQVRSSPDEIAVGDRLVVKAKPRGGGEVRVFRSDGTEVGRCPGSPSCTMSADGELKLEVSLDSPVQYRAIFVIGVEPAALAPPGASMNEYLEAARSADAEFVLPQPIDVH
jgi:hypothetical protein